jgi:ankyrin repeat protein
MRVLFKEIRAGDLVAVVARIDADPDLVRAVAKAPPKKDDGQSVLQVAIKSGNFEVANALIDKGADVNFIDSSALNRWNTPVLHDAIRAAIFSTRWGCNRALPGEPRAVEMMSTLEQFHRASGVLKRIIDNGADLNAKDSFGNPPLIRAVLDARQVLSEPDLIALQVDLHMIFDLLLSAGADALWVDPRTTHRMVDDLDGQPVRQFLPA